MDIGKQRRVIEVAPLETPEPVPAVPDPVPERGNPATIPAPPPVHVPAERGG